MKPLEMVAEWRKGCSVAGPMHHKCFPDGEPLSAGYCVECTEGLIEAISNRLSRPFTDWKPITELPDALKDGRQVMLWDFSGATVCTWRSSHPIGWDSGAASEIDGDPVMVESPALYAEIDPPKGCAWCGFPIIRDTLDGDDLCQSCCEKWARGEGRL